MENYLESTEAKVDEDVEMQVPEPMNFEDIQILNAQMGKDCEVWMTPTVTPPKRRLTYLESDLTPWESLYRESIEKHEKKLSVQEGIDWEFKPFDIDELLNPIDTVSKYFDGARKLGPHCYMWIFYEATRGLIRSDKNKRVFVATAAKRTGRRSWTPSQTAHLRKRLVQCWDKIDHESGHKVISEITQKCNDIQRQLIINLMDRQQTRSTKQKLMNIREMPDFVEFQTYRRNEHKYYKYEYAPIPQGGSNTALPPSAPLRIKIQSVHGLMLQYHDWLGIIPKTK